MLDVKDCGPSLPLSFLFEADGITLFWCSVAFTDGLEVRKCEWQKKHRFFSRNHGKSEFYESRVNFGELPLLMQNLLKIFFYIFTIQTIRGDWKLCVFVFFPNWSQKLSSKPRKTVEIRPRPHGHLWLETTSAIFNCRFKCQKPKCLISEVQWMQHDLSRISFPVVFCSLWRFLPDTDSAPLMLRD